MKHRIITASVLACVVGLATSAQAELRHVELKTLGMD
jgi:hypothetical protein